MNTRKNVNLSSRRGALRNWAGFETKSSLEKKRTKRRLFVSCGNWGVRSDKSQAKKGKNGPKGERRVSPKRKY